MWKVQDPKAKDFFGVGGFNLLRADAVEAFGGMERLRMEIVEDVSLGWLVKKELHRKSMMVLGPGLAKIAWMQGPFGIVSLLEKNAFAGFRYSIGTAVVASVLLRPASCGAALGTRSRTVGSSRVPHVLLQRRMSFQRKPEIE